MKLSDYIQKIIEEFRDADGDDPSRAKTAPKSTQAKAAPLGSKGKEGKDK